MADAVMTHDHRGVRAVQRMVEYAPSTGGLALWVRHRDVSFSDLARDDRRSAPAVMTDGNTIFYGEAFASLPLEEQTGLVAHEVLHIALRHPQRALDLQRLTGDVDPDLFNICADAIVNSTLGHLGWLRLPPTSVFLETLLAQTLGLKQDATTALLAWDVERLYRAIDDRRLGARSGQQSRRSGQSGDGPGETGSTPRDTAQQAEDAPRKEDGPAASRARAMAGRTARDLLPCPDDAAPPEAEAEAAREWSERLLRGHAGDGAFSMLRALIADLPQTRTPWRQVLRTRLARGLSRKPSVSWSRPSRSYIANQGRGGVNRRLPFEPGISPSRIEPRLAVIVDVSGSIDDELMQQFAGEIAAISRRQEAGLVLLIGDDRVRRIEVFKPGCFALDDISFEGGGGTDFTPLLEAADTYRPDIAVVLTDLDGPAHFQPRWPVIWAVPESHAHAVPRFGRLLSLR